MKLQRFQKTFSDFTNFKKNSFHPLLWINGNPKIGKGCSIGGLSEINATGAKVSIGDYCDIASFVSINCADSHKKCIGLSGACARRDIEIEDHVFIGSHCVIKGGVRIGHHSVIAAGTIVDAGKIPAYSLVAGNPMRIKPGYYLRRQAPSILAGKKNAAARSVFSKKIVRPGRALL